MSNIGPHGTIIDFTHSVKNMNIIVKQRPAIEPMAKQIAMSGK